MNRYCAMAVGCVLMGSSFLPSAVLAQEQGHEAHHPEGASTSAAQAPMAQPAAGQAQAAVTQPQGSAPQTLSPLQELRQKMRLQMQALQTAKDPAERRKLLAEHMQAMHDMMSMLQGMMEASPAAAPGGGMMGGPSMMGMMGGKGMMAMMGGGKGMMGGQKPEMMSMKGGQPGGMMQQCPKMGMAGEGKGMMGGKGMMAMMGMMQHMMMRESVKALTERVDALERRLDTVQELLGQLLQQEAAASSGQ
jgi:hypothetical protein